MTTYRTKEKMDVAESTTAFEWLKRVVVEQKHVTKINRQAPLITMRIDEMEKIIAILEASYNHPDPTPEIREAWKAWL